jgi:hypothetical protein
VPGGASHHKTWIGNSSIMHDVRCIVLLHCITSHVVLMLIVGVGLAHRVEPAPCRLHDGIPGRPQATGWQAACPRYNCCMCARPG